MSFINKYDKAPHSYWNSKKRGTIIYSVGAIQVSTNGSVNSEGINFTSRESFDERSAKRMALSEVSVEALITKVDSNGVLIWEKRYKSNNVDKIYFDDLVFCDNNDIIVLGVHDNNEGFSLLRFDEDGNEVWYKFMPPTTNQEGIQGLSVPKILKTGLEEYLVQVDDQFYIDSVLQPENYLYKFDGNGSLILQRRLSSDVGKFSINGITLNNSNNHIALCGSNIKSSVGSIVFSGILIELDQSFDIVSRYTMKTGQNSTEYLSLHDVYATGQYYIVSGVMNDSERYNFLAKIIPPINAEINQTVKVIFSQWFNKCFFNSNFIYLQKNDREDTYITKLNHNLDVLWNKNFDSGNYNYRAIRQVTSSNIIMSNYFIASLNLDLNSCLTSEAEALQYSDKTFWLTPKLDFKVVKPTHALKDYDILEVVVDSKKKEICPTIIDDDDVPTVKDNTLLQSPNFYLQSAGSIGQDSTKGIHLRWIFSGVLGEKHLPKGDYANTNFNFNKPNDFVKIYRAPYVRETFILSFAEVPQTVNDSQKFWLYKFNNDTRIFFVYFRNSAKYNLVRSSIDPMVDPMAFVQSYGNELIEIENKRELFFASDISVANISASSSMQLESLSVPENKIFVPKSLSYRKTLDSSELADARIVCENGRSIRYKTQNCLVTKLSFEFYSDFISATSLSNSWTVMGSYSLTNVDSEVFTRLDPLENDKPVNGAWLRFNDDAYVNTNNYKDRWNGPVESWDRNIRDVVNQYIILSNEYNNPRAIQTIDINLANENDIITIEEDVPVGETPQGGMEVSNLDLLRVASYDYHIARMLGLGTLDLDDLVFDGEFIYLGEYYTFGDLEDGSDGEVHHLSMALPTSLMTQRLPLAVDLKELVPGMTVEDDTTEPNNICDENGYSFDGKKRYISIYTEELLEGEQNPVFFANSDMIDTSTFTLPVYAGLEYKKILIGGADPGIWEKPELSHKLQYLNIDGTSSESYETVPLFLPDEGSPIYMHRQTQSGTHFYSSYGINWFSRATSSEIVLDIFTEIKPFNTLLPPANLNPFLIRRENPLMFTSLLEQERYTAIDDNDDKTLVRLLFDYNSDQELINYQIPLDSNLPDSFYETDPDSIFRDAEEIFGDEIEIYFRDKTPRQISAKVLVVLGVPQISENPINILADIRTESNYQASTGTTLLSEFPQGTTAQNFVGSIFLMGSQQYIIHSVNPDALGLIFTVYKKQISDGMLSNEIPPLDAQNLQIPYYEGDGLFTVVENMQNTDSWGVASNPHNFKVEIGTDDWAIHREVVRVQNDNGLQDRYLEKTRGFWESATIEKKLEDFTFQSQGGAIISKIQTHRGIYKITFNGFQLANHIQTNIVGNSVEWFNGSVRLFTDSNMTTGSLLDSRKVFTVFKTENIGTTNNLVLYVNDPNFVADVNGDPVTANDDILIGTNVLTNYYPSYRVYLNHSVAHNLTEGHTLPNEGEVVRYTIFGLRTVDYDYTNVDGTFYKSRFCAPKLMFANELIGAEVPEQPLGGLYSTRPDFFGKSTYTFTTKYTHKPHGVSFYRSDNQAMLSALYDVDTIKSIFESLKELGGNDEEYFTNRWNNFTNFTQLQDENDYKPFPPTLITAENYKFPLPNKKRFFEEINSFILYHNQTYNDTVDTILEADYGTIAFNETIIPLTVGQNDELKFIDFVKEALLNSFVPLTEVPIIYKFIHTEADYKPVNKKQNIRDRDGYLIDPNTNNPEFDMAPMMKVIGTSPQETQFTDFTLDGTSSNIYFYAVKEISSQMKMGAFSPFLGPIKLVNTNPPEEPKIKSALPVLDNRVLGIIPHIKFEVTAYPQVQNIKKINLYRTTNRLAAESVQSMDLIKIIEIDNDFSVDDSIWTFTDDFSNLVDVPYSETLFYRITVSRKVEYADKNQDVIVEFAPSQPSRILATMVVETYSPESPILNYTAGDYNSITGTSLDYITLNWEQNVYKGNYHIYKMNSQGNWIEIIRVISDRVTKGLYHFYNQDAQGNWVNTIHPEPLNTFNEKIYLPLELTNLATTSLATKTIDGKPIYHHLKVISQNTAGMFSKKENILTMYNAESYTSDTGIGSNTGDDGMVVQGNFVVRHN